MKNNQKNIIDLCIIGSGPAGMTAAIYASRYKVSQIIVGDMPGGLMTTSHSICNYPSAPGVSGMELSQKIFNQVKSMKVPHQFSLVVDIKEKNGVFHVLLASKEIILAKNILLATGTKHRHLNLANEKELTGKGVVYCATCDAMFYKDKVVAVVGGGDSANTASLYLAKVAKQVYQIYRGDSLRGEVAWIDQIKANKKITVIYNTEIKELIGENKLTAIKLNKDYNGSKKINLDGVFIEIGSEPDPTLIKKLALETDQKGYIITKENQQTSRQGVWAAGDITTNSNQFRQIITACSEGAIAAQDIFTSLQAKN
jgi:thioredoxin reductase (NADPH)